MLSTGKPFTFSVSSFISLCITSQSETLPAEVLYIEEEEEEEEEEEKSTLMLSCN
jgi:hypothetical protein